MTDNAPEVVVNGHHPVLNGAASNIIPLRQLCTQLHDQLEAFLQEDVETEILRSVQKRCRHSLGIISEALDRYPFPTLSLSYNGGKDCLVLLILYLSQLSTHPNLPPSLPAIYIPPPDPFAAQDSFVATSSTHYHLSLSQHTHASMRSAFSAYLSSPAGAPIRAIFVGTRRTDPHGATLTPFDITDHGWPRFMRVHPVLEWRYAEVWAFLRRLGVDYCTLYEQGFTSLGGRLDTRPNPVLAIKEIRDGEEVVCGYRPAWELVEDGEERLGRDGKG